MDFNYKYGATKFLYKNHLNTIQGIKFTTREIDVLCCVIHNRGDKKIADILSISPKTVSAHIQSIMRKFNCNSRDKIIDSTELSGITGYLREYYLHLTYRNHFESLLNQLSKKLEIKELLFVVDSKEIRNAGKDFYKIIKDNAATLNCTLTASNEGDLSDLPTFHINRVKEDNYCEDFLQHVLELLTDAEDKKAVSDTINELKKFSDSLSRFQSNEKTILVKTYPSKTKIFIGTVIIFFLSFSIIYILPSEYYLVGRAHRDNPDVVNNLKEFLRVINNEDFTADNVTKDNSHKNHYIVKQIEKLYHNNAEQDVIEYFLNHSDSPEIFMSYLHKMHALSSYYMHHNHDGEKAKQVLSHTKKLVEHYINDRSSTPCNFDELSADEILAELDVIKHLPEMYTRLVYSLGRTYIYLEEPEQGIKYFEIAKILGTKLSLFEAYLSDISGILRIQKTIAFNHIKLGKAYKAIPILEDVAQSYEDLKADNTIYLKDFDPSKDEQDKINPSIVPYNIVYCSEMIITIYNTLLEVVKEKEVQLYYLEKIECNLLQLLKEGGYIIKNEFSTRKMASLLNHMGKSYFLFHKLSLKSEELDNTIKSIFKITARDSLEVSENLYSKASQISRNTDYTKADAFEGLISIYHQRLKQLDNEQGKISFLQAQNERSKLHEKISELTKKVSDINYHLNRSKDK